MRNLGPVEDLIGVTSRQDLTVTQLIAQQDHFAIGVADPRWLHVW